MYYAPCMCQYPIQYPYPYAYYYNEPMHYRGSWPGYWTAPTEFAELNRITIKDYGPQPYVVNINKATKQNNTFRTALWTGQHLQVTLMSINVGEDIGIEIHSDTDQFLRIEQGRGVVRMGQSKDNLNFEKILSDDSAIMVPAGTWHNVINTGDVPLKLYSIYAPPHHPHGTVHRTKVEAMAAE